VRPEILKTFNPYKNINGNNGNSMVTVTR